MALGQKLRAAREAMGLSEADVADSTHIMAQMIREIEAEDYHRFSAPVYGKCFIKLYAKAVGLDPAPLVAEYMETFSKKKDKGVPPPHVMLETIDDHAESGISHVVADVPERHETEGVASPSPMPVHKVAKASTVTMPNTQAPHPLPPSTRPQPLVVSPAPESVTPPNSVPVVEPVAATPVAPVAATPVAATPVAVAPVVPKEPVAAASVESVATTREGFHLEAEPVKVVVPPQPMPVSTQPFQYPVPKVPSRGNVSNRETDSASLRNRGMEMETDLDDGEAGETPAPQRKPFRRPSPEEHSRLRVLCELVREQFQKWIAAWQQNQARRRAEAEAAEDRDDDSDGTEASFLQRKRSWIIGCTGFVVVILLFCLMRGGKDDAVESSESWESSEMVSTSGVEPIPDGVDVPTGVETADPSGTVADVPAGPVEIERVFPAPKCFAR